MAVAIRVENVSKQYRLGVVGSTTIRDDMMRWWYKMQNKENAFLQIGDKNVQNQVAESPYIWSLKNINFDINQGDVVGVIGKNGAGKSTLLKLLSKITAPTTGVIKIKGKVASLLEVGTGFHPELTGRENVYLNGAIMGMNRLEITHKLDEIINFAGVERYIDTPVKRYSSGMYVRLAFAVGAHLDPEILIVDEVLAVGDAEFQNKCIGKMQDISRKEGKTVLFVSHNINSISTLTKKSIVLERGEVKFYGKTYEAIAKYFSSSNNIQKAYNANYNNEKAKITNVEIYTTYADGTQVAEDKLRIKFEIETGESLKNAGIAFQIKNHLDTPIVHIWLFDSEKPFLREKGKHIYECLIPKLRLYIGNYTLSVFLAENSGTEFIEKIEQICPFNIQVIEKHRDFEWQENSCSYFEEFYWEKK